jgi:hypothetical protein
MNCALEGPSPGDDSRRHHRGIAAHHDRKRHCSEVMRRIAAPMVTAAILTLTVIPAVYLLWKQDGLKRSAHQVATAPVPADTTL